MKRFYRLAWLTLLMGLLFACSSPPTGDSVVEEVEEAAQPAVVEVEPTAVEPTDEPPTAEPTEEMEAEMEVEEEEMAAEEPAAADEEEAEPVITAVDGPTHIPAATIEEALAERPYDQAKGADVPLMTIIEYGDFQ